MSPKHIGPIAQVWYRWKALRLPWRKRLLVGYDLEGNTYWEFRLSRDDSERWRRIVHYPRSTHYSQVKVSPVWHQWLRYTRQDPPGMGEQRVEVTRQTRMKQLAADADARWDAKPRMMDAPGGSTGQRLPPLKTENQQGRSQNLESETQQTTQARTEERKEGKEDPWAEAKARGPAEAWKPTSWNPTPTSKR